MRKAFLALMVVCLPVLTGCALSDVFYNLFGNAYSGGGNNDSARYADYNDRVQAARSPPTIRGASSSPFPP